MNEQNNNNSFFNNQPANNFNNNQPTRPTKSKFFPSDLFGDADIGEVNSSTSNGANSQFLSRTTWGVGASNQPANNLVQNNTQNNVLNNTVSTPVAQVPLEAAPEPEVLNLFNDNVETLMDDVNGTVYNYPVESLEPNYNEPNNMVNQNVNPTPMPINNQVYQEQNQQMAQSPNGYVNNKYPQDLGNMGNINNQYMNPTNGLTPNNVVNNQMPSTGMVNNDPNAPEVLEEWMNQQPLSMSSLGVNDPNGENAPKEYVDDNKFINLAQDERPGTNVITEQKQQTVPVEQLTKPKIGGVVGMFEEPLPDIDEVKVCKEFVGSEFQKITMSPFSFAGLIFGSGYLAYRKMYIVAIALLCVEIVLLNIVPFPICLIAFAVFRLVLALTVNQLYLKIVSAKVGNLRKHNRKKNQYELSILASKRGGTNFLVGLVVILLFLGTSATLNAKNVFKSFKDAFLTKEPAPNEFNGKLSYEDTNITNYYNIIVPNEFIKNNDNNFSYVYNVENEDSKSNCSLSFNAIKDYTNGEDLIKVLSKYHKDIQKEEVKSIEANGITWYNLYTEDDVNRIYYRGTTIDNKAILLEYKISKDSTDNVCDTYYVEILDSISVKEEN